MSSSEHQLNGIGDNVRVEPVTGIPPLSDVSGDEEHHKDYLDDMQSHLTDSEKVVDSVSEDEHKNSSPRHSAEDEHGKSSQRQSKEDERENSPVRQSKEDEHEKSPVRQSTEDEHRKPPSLRQSTEDGEKPDMGNVKHEEGSIKQDELLFYPSPDSYETDLDSAEQQEATFRQVLHLGPTNSLTRASAIWDNYWFTDWGAYLVSHGMYMVFLSCIYLIVVYASLELLYYMANKKQ